MENQNNMDKIQIIKEIVKHHPGYGTDKGWSRYTGGMKDSGYWLWDVMVDVREHELQVFLDYLKGCDKEVEERRKEMERISRLPKEEQEAIYQKEMQEQARLWNKWHEEMERYLIWGK